MDKTANRIRVVIADDHPILRDGLRKVLDAEGDFCVVGEAADGAEAVKAVRQIKPDILLLDLLMPEHSGLEALTELAGLQALTTRTIVLAANIEKPQIAQAIQLGAHGVVLKESATRLLVQCIHSVMNGRYWVGHEVVSDLVEVLRELMSSSKAPYGRADFDLTAREKDIVAAIVCGYTNRDVAQKFSLSEQTVKHHLTNIFDKLGVSNRLELALFAVNHNLVDDS